MKQFDVIGAKKRIALLRDELQLSQEELGGRFGMSRAGYSAAENPLNKGVFFTPVQLINLKYELKVCYDFLLEGIGTKDSHLLSPAGEKTENSSAELENAKKEILQLRKEIAMQQRLIESLERENLLLRK